MERNVLADRVKGYACFLVLFGHVILGMRNSGVEMPWIFSWLETFIWSFHVALFLFVSGAVYRVTGEWKGKGTKKNFIKHKAIALGIPYLVFSVVYILINSMVEQANTLSSWTDIFFLWRTPVAQYWYLYALFFLFCVWTVWSELLANWQITLGTFLVAYLAPALFGVQFGCFDVVMFSSLAFGLGTCVSLAKLEKVPVVWKIAGVVLHIVIGVIWISRGWTETPILSEILTVIGIFAGVFLISVLQKGKLISCFLDFMNKYSFQIYLLHTIFTAAVRILLLRVGITNWIVHIIVGCIAGLFCSVLAAVISKKLKWTEFFFFPTKFLSGKKTKAIPKANGLSV